MNSLTDNFSVDLSLNNLRFANRMSSSLAALGVDRSIASADLALATRGTFSVLDSLKSLSGSENYLSATSVLGASSSDRLATLGAITSMATAAENARGAFSTLDSLKSLSGSEDYLSAASVLAASSADRLANERREWDRIGQVSQSHFNAVEDEWDLRPISPIIDNSVQFQISARTREEDQRYDRQFELLSAIADAGKNQSETMGDIVRLQELLVKEAVENSQLQRTVLYFAALSAALALFALFK